MKNKFLLSAALIFLMAGCSKKTDEIFDQSPDQRLAAALTSYEQTLTSAPNGWKVFIAPKGLEKSDNISVGGFSYYMKFANNRVTMLSDFDTTKAEVFNESGYRLKAAQRISIYFDTYSYIHFPADPNTQISASPTGDNGIGWGSDLEFAITDQKVQGDTIHLMGNQNGSIGIMVKATKAEADSYNAKGLKASMKNLKNLNLIGYFKSLNIGGKQYYLNINEGDRTLIVSWLDANGNVQTASTGYYSTLTGIYFTNPVNTGSIVIRGIDFVTWTPATTTMTVTVNGTAGTITNGGAPLKIDLEAPLRWWKYSYDREERWHSQFGFTVNGVVDAYGLRTIPSFYQLAFFAWYGTSGTTQYDLLTPIKLNAAGNGLTIAYGFASVPPTFTTDGRIIFSALGILGTVPAADATIFANTYNKFRDANGYYLIQTGPLRYDMVSKNGSAWITWEW